MKYDTVIFDMDGTLLNTIDDLAAADNRALRDAGLPEITVGQAREYVGNGVRNLMLRSVYGPDAARPFKDTVDLAAGDIKKDAETGAEFVQTGDGKKFILTVSLEKFEEVLEDFRRYYSDHSMDKTRAYTGIEEVLDELSARGCRMAVVSNKFDAAVRKLAAHYFPAIHIAIGMQNGLAKKPAPDMVDRALQELGSSREHAVYVGDSEVDVATAANSGMDCITCLWGFRERDFLEAHGARCFAEKPSDILKFVERGAQ